MSQQIQFQADAAEPRRVLGGFAFAAAVLMVGVAALAGLSGAGAFHWLMLAGALVLNGALIASLVLAVPGGKAPPRRRRAAGANAGTAIRRSGPFQGEVVRSWRDVKRSAQQARATRRAA